MRRITLILCLCAVVLVSCDALGLSSGAPALTQTYEDSPTAFTFNYPEGWLYHIPQQGLLIVAPPGLFKIEPEKVPSLSIQRSMTLMGAETLRAALEDYLEAGPMRRDQNWERQGEIADVEIGGREAVMIDIKGHEKHSDGEDLHARIYVLRADNGFVYVLTATAPDAEWGTHHPTLDAIIKTFSIIE
jgi:hypothetical protein